MSSNHIPGGGGLEALALPPACKAGGGNMHPTAMGLLLPGLKGLLMPWDIFPFAGASSGSQGDAAGVVTCIICFLQGHKTCAG